MRGGGERGECEDDEAVAVVTGVGLVAVAAVGDAVAQNTISRISRSSFRISSVLAATKYDDGVPSITADRLFMRVFMLASCWDNVSRAVVNAEVK